ncbi:MAG: non-canonical purine NTP pyrophosphatase [Candidatus Gracilibacteria bacterium]|nr:non-canonical purine NTP pyrophosphatase [Candidatus Gracilibacteria bacterium]
MNLPTFGTTNKHKLEESSKILGIKLEGYTQEDLEKIKLSGNGDLREIQSMNIIEIVEQKARDVYDILGKPVYENQ